MVVPVFSILNHPFWDIPISGKPQYVLNREMELATGNYHMLGGRARVKSHVFVSSQWGS